jgi:hypothetical protein
VARHGGGGRAGGHKWTKLERAVIEKLREILGKARKGGRYRPHGDYEGAPGKLPKVDPETGLPIERRHEPNPKHREQGYRDPRRNEWVSRQPRGDPQEILDNSMPNPNSPNRRIGIEPGTGLPVEFKQHLRQEFKDRIREDYHGFVPDATD